MPLLSTLTISQKRIAVIALVMLLSGTAFCIVRISIVTIFIIGIPGLVAYCFWFAAYLRQPTAPSVILPVFLATVAGFQFHLIDEYLRGYPLAISRIFGFAWTEHSFFITIVILFGGLSLATIGLYYRKPIAGFVAILFMITRFAEVALFIFPFVKPAIQPHIAIPVSQYIGRSFMVSMPSYYYAVTGRYYFPGMYTIWLAIIPAGIALYSIWKAALTSIPIPDSISHES